MLHARAAGWPASLLLLGALAAASCTYQFDRDRFRDADARDASEPADAAARDAALDPCTGASDGTPCPDGLCSAGACCTGCVTELGCEAGDTADACGGGGLACRRCTGETPLCGEGRCRVARPVVQVALGSRHTCVRDHEGQLFCWGADDAGQLGVRPSDGACAASSPLLVPLPGRVADVSASARGTCALLEDGSGYCWGEGLVGAGTVSPASTCIDAGMPVARVDPASIEPVRVLPSEPPLRWRALAVGDRVRFGLDDRGLAHYWGDYDYDMRPPPDQPVRVPGVEVELEVLSAHGQSALGLTADDRAFLWSRTEQELGEPLASDVALVSAGLGHHCIAYRDGRIECRGLYLPSAWAEGPTGGRLVPRTDDAEVTSIAVTYLAAPIMVCWTNVREELWCTFSPDEPLSLTTETRFTSVAIGQYGFAAIDTAGRLWSWHTEYVAMASVRTLPP